jgi:hypothetical protein
MEGGQGHSSRQARKVQVCVIRRYLKDCNLLLYCNEEAAGPAQLRCLRGVQESAPRSSCWWWASVHSPQEGDGLVQTAGACSYKLRICVCKAVSSSCVLTYACRAVLCCVCSYH